MIEAAPLPVPAPAPAPAPVGIANPLIGIAPALVAAPVGLNLAVVAGGVRLPVVQLAEAPVIDELPISRAGSEVGESAFLPAQVKPIAPAAPAPVVPVYPRKQARY